jgi:hypothetical protein
LVRTSKSSAVSKLPKELPNMIQYEPATYNDEHHHITEKNSYAHDCDVEYHGRKMVFISNE